MLLFDESRKLEKALGEEAAAVIAHVFEKADTQWRQELATKADLLLTTSELQAEIAKTRAGLEKEIAKTKYDIVRWMVGGFLAQSALLVAVIAFLK
jgi:hypothetical protein